MEYGELEREIDKHGLFSLLAAIADICDGKAEHIRCNWQDNTLATDWDAAAKQIQRAASLAAERGLIRIGPIKD